MHAIPIQGSLQCQVDSCNTSYQDPNQFFSHLNHEHSLPIPMTPIEEIDLSNIQLPAQPSADEEVEEVVSAIENAEGPEIDNHLSCCSRKHKMGPKEGFSQRGKLERHMASHTGFKECTCDFPGCGKTFAAQQSFEATTLSSSHG
ncbi:hypothetical protein EYC84_009960 [Monilinia fructicola]|uniref:C2H2-type domain-containing protein n=1 Tax=Monilinia fructicola TaxID=38448 RepID=A0A5M9JC69_MONFR|nr:hypothetical protein EYC84_009960 [Monilinia fructicola]